MSIGAVSSALNRAGSRRLQWPAVEPVTVRSRGLGKKRGAKRNPCVPVSGHAHALHGLSERTVRTCLDRAGIRRAHRAMCLGHRRCADRAGRAVDAGLGSRSQLGSRRPARRWHRRTGLPGSGSVGLVVWSGVHPWGMAAGRDIPGRRSGGRAPRPLPRGGCCGCGRDGLPVTPGDFGTRARRGGPWSPKAPRGSGLRDGWRIAA